MFADFYIPRLSSDMKTVVQKNPLRVKFYTEVWTLLKTEKECPKVSKKFRNL